MMLQKLYRNCLRDFLFGFCGLSFCRLIVEDRMRSKHAIHTYARPHTIPRTHTHTRIQNTYIYRYTSGIHHVYIVVIMSILCRDFTTLNGM